MENRDDRKAKYLKDWNCFYYYYYYYDSSQQCNGYCVIPAVKGQLCLLYPTALSLSLNSPSSAIFFHTLPFPLFI